MKISLYIQTIRYLKGKQIFYQIWYRIRKMKRIKISLIKKVSGFPLTLNEYIDKPETFIGNSSFCFLNNTEIVHDWHYKSNTKLWRYNLYYMDYLLLKNESIENKKEWINSFIIGISENEEALESYPIALRCINWIKFISISLPLISEHEKKQWDEALYRQYILLYYAIEYHLLGNHLLEDAFSLLFGGLYFKENKFYKKAVHLLKKELNEQILPDGAHYELSPMYHEILLDRLLDCINALKNNICFENQKQITSFMEEKAELMLNWLSNIIYKDGTIPLLNDAAYGIAPDSQELFAYAKRLGIRWSERGLKESGYRKFISDRFEMILDVAHIGPDYIPGHAHADTFSYELRIDGKPFIIDTGISTYEKNTRRQYERETQAHNTVQVAGQSSSKVWGGFRVARRAKISYLKEENNRITARHNGFKQFGIEHQRIFELKDTDIIISDSLLPRSDKKGMNAIHLHPDIKILSVNQEIIQTNLATFIFYGADKIWVEECKVAFEYNKLQPTKKICIAFINRMKYVIQTDKL